MLRTVAACITYGYSLYYVRLLLVRYFKVSSRKKGSRKTKNCGGGGGGFLPLPSLPHLPLYPRPPLPRAPRRRSTS